MLTLIWRVLRIPLGILMILIGLGFFAFGFVVAAKWSDLMQAYTWVGLPAFVACVALGFYIIGKRPKSTSS